MTVADHLRPAEQSRAIAFDFVLIAGGSILIALSAQVRLPLPFSPVPVTGQTFAVLLLGALLGRWRGAATVLAYLGEGVAGLPFFAGGGAGPAYVVGPTGGYLAGFLVAAWATGWLAERGWNRGILRVAAAMAIGSAAILGLGALWLANFVGTDRAFAAGVVPFLVGDAAKIALAAALLPAVDRWIDRQ